jgi:hypothetical protein
MSVEAIKRELDQLSLADCQELLAYLARVRWEKTPLRERGSAPSITEETQWVTLEEADARLDWLPDRA